MNLKKHGKIICRWVMNYFTFFVFVAFVIICCTMLFVSTLSYTLDLTLNNENLAVAAKLTFLNVIFLSFIFCVIDMLRRKWTVERPVKRITDAAEKIMQGDFSVRIKPQNRLATDEIFEQITDCFNKMAEELGSVETLRTDFIANVSHEMKTPLAVMQNYGTLLQAPALSEEKRIEYAKGITDSTRRMGSKVSSATSSVSLPSLVSSTCMIRI